MEKKLRERIKEIRTKDTKATVTFNPEQTAITVLRGLLAPPVDVEKLKKAPFDSARRFIRENRELLGGIDEAKELVDGRAQTDRLGTTHVMLTQKHGRVPVLGAAVSVHYASDGTVSMLKSNIAYGIDAPEKAKITSDAAVRIAMKHAGRGSKAFQRIKPALLVADAATLHLEKEPHKYYLCWRMRIVPPKNSRDADWIYLVDAVGGKVLLRYPALQTIGTGYYSQGTDLNSEYTGTTYRLRDTVTSAAWPEATKPVIHTYDDACSGSLSLRNYSEDPDDNWDNGGAPPASRCDDQSPEVDIHRFMGYVLSYYYLTHGRNSWDGGGAETRGHAHNMYLSFFGLMPNNAFWDPDTKELYFGDGDGTDFDFVNPLDVAGHELTHAVNTGFDVVQTYDGETGALNEALADVFGTIVALDYPADCPDPWKVGEQVMLTARGRDLTDPSRDSGGVVHYDDTNNTTKFNSALAGYYPDHYSIRYTGTDDYHGVHINATIIGHAVYLMITSGTHRLSGVTVAGIGLAPVEQMLYYVISTAGFLTNTSVFADFRTAFIVACQTLYPENLDYLAAVKSAFHAVGIGPDLYIRDRLVDQGEEPGTLSCMSPDIIVRQQTADAATLVQIADPGNASLCQNIELGPDDHYVYFRIFNRGSVSATGTFRLFISPVSSFPTPATWHEVGQYDFPTVAANGGMWVPAAADQCLTLPATLINALGTGHFCFIGIIESEADPAPDWTLIDNVTEFHSFVSKSNNFAWRNCDIVDDVLPSPFGVYPMMEKAFQMNGFGRRHEKRQLEVDTRDVPEGTKVVMWIPANKFYGLRAADVRAQNERVRVKKVAGAIEELMDARLRISPVPLDRLVNLHDLQDIVPANIPVKQRNAWRPVCVPAGTLVRLDGLELKKEERMDVRLTLKFPDKAGTRDVTLALRERMNDETIGQVNYIFRIREAAVKLQRRLGKKA